MRAAVFVAQPRFWPVALTVAASLFAAPASAQWLQWDGPHRDFTCDSKGLAEKWPADGPRQIWKGEIGPGHSAIVTDGQTLFTMCRRGEQDAVLAYNAATGEKLWETRYDAPPKDDMLLEFGPGPHSTPLLVGKRLFTVGGMVHLHALDTETGKILWSHDLMQELGASHVQRGYGASPIAYNDTVILNVGGGDVGVAAFKQDTGELVWKSERFRGGYPSPIIVQFNGEDHLVGALAADRIGLDPATGKTRWRATVDVQMAGIMSSPLFVPPDRVFFSEAYGGGSQLFKISFQDGKYAAEQLWHTPKMKVMHGNSIRIGDYVYGSSGDFGPAFLMALQIETGKVAWRERGFAKSTLLYADGKLIILDEEGNLALATATPEKLEVHARAKVLDDKSWTVPTLVGTRLYLRDNHNILALDLGAAANG
jgi:outer membrane protein assembly factor BamB